MARKKAESEMEGAALAPEEIAEVEQAEGEGTAALAPEGASEVEQAEGEGTAALAPEGASEVKQAEGEGTAALAPEGASEVEQAEGEETAAPAPEGASEAEQAEGEGTAAPIPDEGKMDSQEFPNKYRIICRNNVTKQIGGVDFKNGVGYTFDGYAASWFAAKDGYTVEPAE